jgi:hypothetical protein
MSNLARFEAEHNLPLELRPRSVGLKNGVEHVRRLRSDVERCWPFFAKALENVGLVRSISAVAVALWEDASEIRAANHAVHRADGRWAVIEESLAKELRERGLSIKIAAGKLGIPMSSLTHRMQADPGLRTRLEGYRLAGLAALHEKMHALGLDGSESAIVKLLEWSGEPEYTPRLKIQEPNEGEIVRSKAWARLTSRLAGVLCPECRARAAEAVGEG